MGFRRVLIANRGEIALRILRTLRDMGIEAAIIHGKEDRLSLPVMMSDVAYPNYRTNPLDSYLDIESVIAAAKELECDAVHPGYGFLAENAHFVKRLTEEGITFIGHLVKLFPYLVIKSRPEPQWKQQVCRLLEALLSQFQMPKLLTRWQRRLVTR